MTQPVKNERRKSVRIGKNLIVSYFLPAEPSRKFSLSQIKNISRGGVCFVTTENFELMTNLAVEFVTPYLSETSALAGTVVGCTEKISGLLYETRMKFENLAPVASAFLDDMINYFMFEENNEDN